MSENKFPTRREMLRKTTAASAAVAAPMIVPASVFGQNAPSNRVVMGCIGVGWQGTLNMNQFLKEGDVQMVAISDVDKKHMANAVGLVNKRHGNKDCASYDDFRELIARDDIDAIAMGLPDHWHAIPAIMAMNAGKDVWGEKPLSHKFTEGQAIVASQKKNKRVWQTGSWQRSIGNFQAGVKLVQSGVLGKIHRVEVGLPGGHSDFAGTGQFNTPTDPPDHLDYNMWIGPAQMEPYIKGRHHKNWRWNYNIGGGQLMDWIGHHNDIAHWGLGLDYGGPIEVTGYGYFPDPDAMWNTATKYTVISKYPDDLEIVIRDAPGAPRGGNAGHGFYRGTKWIGEEGWVHVDRGKYSASNKEWTKGKIPFPTNHWRQFIDCIKSREKTLTPAEVAHRSATPGHLGLISMRLGRTIKWDLKTETIKGDPTATEMLGRDLRKPWSLDV